MPASRGVQNPIETEYFLHWFEVYRSKTGKNERQIASDLGIEPPTLNDVIKNGSGVGMKMLRGWAALETGGSLDELHAIAQDWCDRIGFVPGESSLLPFSRRPGWAKALEQAQRDAPHYTAEHWAKLSRATWPEGNLTPRLLVRLAHVLAELAEPLDQSNRRNRNDGSPGHNEPSHSGNFPVKPKKPKK